MSLFLLFPLLPQQSQAGDGKKIKEYKRTGTFSDLQYHKGPGDIVGVEIRIVETNAGYQATIQIAEGGPGWLELVDVIIKDNEIFFTIPQESLWAGNFRGHFTDKGIKGKFIFSKAKKGHEVEEIDLPRRKSYWD